MDKVQLVEADIREGERVVAAVRASENLVAALWSYRAESSTYNLVLALPEESPLAAYRKVQAILSHLNPPSPIGLEDIRIVKDTDPLISELRLSLDVGAPPGIRLTHATFGQFYLEDAYIYYLAKVATITNEKDTILAVKEDIWRGVPA